MKDEIQKESVEKKILTSLFDKFIHKNEKNEGLLKKYINILVHTSLKLEAYAILIRALETLNMKYRIKENHMNNTLKTVYTVFTDPNKNKAIDLEITNNVLRCSTYMQLCINRFIPLRPMVEIKLCELESLLLNTIDHQQSIIKLIAES